MLLYIDFFAKSTGDVWQEPVIVRVSGESLHDLLGYPENSYCGTQFYVYILYLGSRGHSLEYPSWKQWYVRFEMSPQQQSKIEERYW